MTAVGPSLPRLLVLTDRSQCPGTLRETVAAAIDGGARWVCLREKDLSSDERRGLATELAALLAPVDGLLSVAADSLPADPCDAGLHLAASVADPPSTLRTVSGGAPIGRSCHDADELDRARLARLDYVTFSPIFLTSSKPGYGPALGVESLGAAAQRFDGPVFALGGITPARAAACCDAGAHGVAVMGEVMRAPDATAVTETVRSFLEALPS